MRNAVLIFATVGAVAACAPDTVAIGDASEATQEVKGGHKRDAAVQTSPDASSSSGGTAGSVSCYTQGAPANTCTLPTHCCFSNYSAQHDGFCANNACTWGTISCDGPEDCGGGGHCCATQLHDSNGDISGYSLACQASACSGDELCHTSSTCGGKSCVTALGNNNDLPRTLDICR